ncbi:MAG: putative transformylase [Nitrospira sp.]|jgi:methionyl-tRNA formyltransferase|nr:MAG: putative transformylase [Nitrospira sp.]
MKPLLLGGTDLTAAVAERMRKIGIPPIGVVHVGARFTISYEPAGVTNIRHVDLPAWCDAAGIPHQTYQNSKAVRSFAEALGADFCLAAGWFHMVPAELRAAFRRGTAGLHASLLPRLRGGAPLNWALLSGETETGISLFALGDGVDDGPLYGQERFPIGPRTTIGELVAAAEAGGLALVDRCLPGIAGGELRPRPQTGQPSYCLQRVPSDGWINWAESAERIDRLIRAVGRPYPGAFGYFEGRKLLIWSAEPAPASPTVLGAPGQLARVPDQQNPWVVTGHGCLILREVTDTQGTDALTLLRRSGNKRFDPMPLSSAAGTSVC